jgi:hypothetical protein
MIMLASPWTSRGGPASSAPRTRRLRRSQHVADALGLALDAQAGIGAADLVASHPVGAENWVTSCDLQVLVDEAAEPVSS